ncbi:MAG: hypothetical protein JRN20_17420 [Nitrososphaerota archaeon]|nr:hypothetical protein [Nitrososphaerota archaeon]
MSEAQERPDSKDEAGRKKESEAKKKSSISLSVRLIPELHDVLKGEAERQSITISALITNILTKYTKWDRSVERFGFVTIGRHSFKTILDSVSEEKLDQAAVAGGEHMKDYIQFWRSKPNIEDFLRALQIWSRHGGIAQFELKKDEHEEAAREYTITLYHDFGEKWSRYQKSLVESALRSMFNIAPIIEEMSENSITFSFSSP